MVSLQISKVDGIQRPAQSHEGLFFELANANGVRHGSSSQMTPAKTVFLYEPAVFEIYVSFQG